MHENHTKRPAQASSTLGVSFVCRSIKLAERVA